MAVFLCIKDDCVLLIWLSGQGRGGALRRPGGRGQGVRRDRGRGRGRGGAGRGEKVSADDLDADLEKYHAEAMQLN